MTGKVKVKVGVAIAVPTLLAFTLGVGLWLNRPFQVEIASYRTSLADRTEAQRHNIRQAAMALDGVVIEPGETFSFNQAVGPRTPERGYCEAPSFLERDVLASFGGGICQVSSTLYNAALLAGLEVVERHQHNRKVASVPPGRDSTVWYGLLDLRLTNRTSNPVLLSALIANDLLVMNVRGDHDGERKYLVRTIEVSRNPRGSSTYNTVRLAFGDTNSLFSELLSVDVYLD